MVIRLKKLEDPGAGGLPRQNFPRLERDIGKFGDAGLILAFGKRPLEIVEGDMEIEPIPGNDIPAALRIDAEGKAPATELLLKQNLDPSRIAQVLACLSARRGRGKKRAAATSEKSMSLRASRE